MAQLVARLVRNEKVRGSNPLSSTKRKPRPTRLDSRVGLFYFGLRSSLTTKVNGCAQHFSGGGVDAQGSTESVGDACQHDAAGSLSSVLDGRDDGLASTRSPG